MTGAEAIIKLKIELDKLDSGFYPEISDEVCVVMLNDATERYIKQRYTGTNPKQKGFEENQKRTDDLRNVVEYAIINTPVANTFFQNAVDFTLPVDYWFSVLEQVDVNYTNCKGLPAIERKGVKAVQHNNINAIEVDPFNRPEGVDVVRVMKGNAIQVIHDGTVTISILYLGYVSNDFKIDINNLSQQLLIADHAQNEVIDLAVSRILENIESRRYGSHHNELNKQE